MSKQIQIDLYRKTESGSVAVQTVHRTGFSSDDAFQEAVDWYLSEGYHESHAEALEHYINEGFHEQDDFQDSSIRDWT